MPTIGADLALPIETVRLRLRALSLADAPSVERLAGDWEIARYTAHIPHPYPPGGAAPWIEETWAEAVAGKKLVAAIERRGDGIMVGCIELDLTQGGGLGSLGYWVGRPYWGSGIASEAGAAMMALGFERLGLSKIEAAAVPANRRSIRVQEKLGLGLVGEREEAAPARGTAMRTEVRALGPTQGRPRIPVSARALVGA